MKSKIFSMCCLIALSSLVHANGIVETHSGHPAIQGSIATNGNVSAGVAYYTETTEIGLLVSASINNASSQTKLFVPAFFAGFRKTLLDNTYFAYGLDLATKVGRESGEEINSYIAVGPYISLEQALTKHFLLVGWIEPYSFEYEKKCSVSTSTNHIFSMGGLGISYLF